MYLVAIARCQACGRLFGANPYLVPVVGTNGERHPVCRECLAHVNEARRQGGRAPLPVPDGAYDPAEEEEVWNAWDR
jgi:hypothetical protein